MASGNEKDRDGAVMEEEQLEVVEYELQRSRIIEENDKGLAAARATRASMQKDMEANQALKRKERYVASIRIIFYLKEANVAFRTNVTC